MECVTRPARRLSASIVTYHSAPELVQRTLASLYRAAGQALSGPDDRLSIHLVDNASGGDYSRQLQALVAGMPAQPGVELHFVGLGHNGGFGAGHNAVLDAIDSHYHLVLNPDAELDPDALEAGLERLEGQAEAVLVSPHVRASDGTQEFLCKRYPSVLVLFLRAFAPASLQRLFAARLADYQMEEVCAAGAVAEVPLASGCCMLVRSVDLLAVGGFDENYFLYFEDFDLSLRLATRGRLLFEPAMRIVHHGGYAASKGLTHVKYFVRSGMRFFRQHGWRWI